MVRAAKLNSQVKRIIFISSTGIYQGLSDVVNEENELEVSINKVNLLVEAEQAVLAFNQQSSVLRLAGLVGPERHPGKFLLAKKVLSDAESKVNLIHQTDAVGLTLALLSQPKVAGIYNGVSDTHVSKQEYYQRAAQAIDFQLPEFTPSKATASNRVVCGDKAKQLLGYTFVYPDLLAWL